MDRYDRIIHDVLQKTEAETIHWEVANADRYSQVHLKPGREVRAYTAVYPVGRKEYGLLFAESRKKFEDAFGGGWEGRDYELFVLGTGCAVGACIV